MNKVCFLGSINMDMVIKVKSMPKEGETILADGIKKISGGKGANQAIAAARMGSKVYIIGRVGKDENGHNLINKMVEDGVNVNNVLIDDKEATGTAIITVNDNGNNSIIVISGANMSISSEQVMKAEEVIKRSDICAAQLETQVNSLKLVFKLAKKYGRFTILNPSPAKKLDEELIENTDIMVPNETEMLSLSGVQVYDLKSAEKASEKFIRRGMKAVIITLGEKGAVIVTKYKSELIPAYKVKAIDTTAAGDSFLGTLVSKIDTKNVTFENLKQAVIFGNKVSSIVVQRRGAQPSIPKLSDLRL
ncbi:MAG: ribokinase [Clostridium sp.]|nr:ribokinase [Clostridium sp.]